ncbi:MAG: LuxR C-terminal-related transcriptional regulator [Citrobacter telavivensis]
MYAKKHKLSPKELEVIAIVVAGSKLGDVARTSNRSTKTLYSHKRNACFKIGVSSDVDFFCIIFIGLAKNYE